MKPHVTRETILLLGAFSGALLALAGCDKLKLQQQPPAPKPVAITPPHAGDPGLRSTGAAAIAPPAGGQITEPQVRAFVTTHRIPRTLSVSKATIREVSLTTPKVVSARLHSAPLRVADDEPLYLVILDGNFVFPGPPNAQSPTYPVAVEVFDARTGRLLQFGGMPARALEPAPAPEAAQTPAPAAGASPARAPAPATTSE